MKPTDADRLWHIDCHVHTEYSSDGMVSLEKVADICRKKRLEGIAVTDHNTIEGALKLKEIVKDDIVIIIGEEIKTREGEITGLFLKRHIPSGLLPEDSIDRIKQQGGLVSIPHPFCRHRRSKLSRDTLMRIIEKVDAIEVFNSRNLTDSDNEYAYQFALETNKGMIVGSDAHLSYEYGMSYVEMPPFSDAETFKKNLVSAKLITRKGPLWTHLITKVNKIFFSKRCKRKYVS